MAIFQYIFFNFRYPDTLCEQSVSDVTDSFTEEQRKKKIHHYVVCKGATACMCHKKKELALRQLKRNRCLTTTLSSRRIWLTVFPRINAALE